MQQPFSFHFYSFMDLIKMKSSQMILVLTIIFVSYCLHSNALDVSYDNRAIKIDGQRRIIISGSIHYPRSTPEMWPSLIKKAKEGGLNAIETYVFWNAHEPLRRQYDFSGNLDLIRFLRIIQNEGLYALLRIGPYVCAEWNYGGFPVWLHNTPNVTFRTNNEAYLAEMKTFTTLIVDMVKHENLFASQGGPIILAQIENEYGNVIGSYGNEGKSYIQWCADFAQSLDVGVPWIMCQEDDAPQSMINTCNGWYCDQFFPKNPHIPKIWTENWTGWFKNWGGKDPHRTAEDLAFAVGRFYQYGGTLQNYYMYHGGTNFGRTAGGPYISTTYDYDAPLDEYGNLNQPKWGHLKQLHFLLRSMEKTLTNGVSKNIEMGNMVTVTIYDDNGKRVCFFGSANEKEDKKIDFEGRSYTVPAWSVTILPDCITEVYNTARVNSQTSIMVKKPEEQPQTLEWTWRAEHFDHLKFSKKSHPLKGVTYANQLLDQKVVTNDISDYLWYMTSVDIDDSEPFWGDEVMLQVHTSGHVLHAFVNGKHIGTKWAKNGQFKFVFQEYCKIKRGQNSISLLSVTVGLQNYGAYFDKVDTGILGPVKLIAPNSEELDLSSNQWVYRVGLNGVGKELYRDDTRYNRKWHPEKLPINRMFVWYKTTFKTPLGEDPVVLDLGGLGKGTAWVNGHDIGRYWPSYHADQDGCSSSCDFRGTYTDKKCLTNCGQPSQRWYHVPRSFLGDEENTLVVFEEFGGNPYHVNVQTVTIGQVCGNAYEGNTLELSCQGGKVISEIKFGSFGDPKGSCGAFEKGSCHYSNTLSIIEQACVGKESCSIDVSNKTFEPTGCNSKRLAVEAVC